MWPNRYAFDSHSSKSNTVYLLSKHITLKGLLFCITTYLTALIAHYIRRVGYDSAPPIRRRRFGAGHFGAIS